MHVTTMSDPMYMGLETMPDTNTLGLAITSGQSALSLATMTPKTP